jgi:hypothetical protein
MKKLFNVFQLGKSPRRKKITDPKEPKIRPSRIRKTSVNIPIFYFLRCKGGVLLVRLADVVVCCREERFVLAVMTLEIL